MWNSGRSNKRTRLLFVRAIGAIHPVDPRHTRQRSRGMGMTIRNGQSAPQPSLPTIVLDNQRLVELWHLNLIAGRKAQHLPAQITGVDTQPLRCLTGIEDLPKVGEVLTSPALGADGHDIVRPHDERRNIGLSIVHREVTVADKLPRLLPRVGKAEAIDDIIESALENLEQVVAGNTTPAHRLIEVLAKLRLHHAVEAPNL